MTCDIRPAWIETDGGDALGCPGELVRLGHSVEVLSGPPYPELDPGVTLTRVESLDLYREPDPFRTPARAEFRDATDVLEFLTMRVGGFGEPRSFCTRAARILWARQDDFDVVLDNQSLGPGLLLLPRALPLVAMIHHPISVDRRVEIAAAPDAARRASLRRWYRFVRMQARVARRLPDIVTVSTSSAAGSTRDFRVPRERITVVPVGVDPAVFTPAAAPLDPPGGRRAQSADRQEPRAVPAPARGAPCGRLRGYSAAASPCPAS